MPTCLCIGGLVLVADAAAWVLSAQTGDSRWLGYIASGTTILVAFFGAVVLAAPHMAKAAAAFATAMFPVFELIWKQRDQLTGETKKLRQDLAENTRITAEAQAAAKKLGEEAKDAAQRNTETIEKLLEQNRELAEQNTKLQATIEDDRQSTNKARDTLHAIRKEFNIATLQHREQRTALIAQQDALIVQVAALTKSLDEARQEIAEFQRRERDRLNHVVAGQERQDVKIEETKAVAVENRAAIAEQAAAIERIAGNSSGEMPVVKDDETTNG